MGSIFNAIPSLNCSLSTVRREAGHYLEIAMSYINFPPLSKSWKIIESLSIISGRNLTLIIASVIIPKIPSDPKINSWRSGPELALGTVYCF